MRYFSTSAFLLGILVVIVCGIYPLALWCVGQTLFPFQANGSMVTGTGGKLIGSKLIAQAFTHDEYFQPRPSAASYDASASASSALAASNYALRDRIARQVGPLAEYANGQAVAVDLEKWFQQDIYQGRHGIVAQWANAHNSLAQAWVSADPTHAAYIESWAAAHLDLVAQYIKDNPGAQDPKPVDLAVVFFQNFAATNPGKFPGAVTTTDKTGKSVVTIQPVNTGTDIQSIFFDMWRQVNSTVKLKKVPGDLVTTSASGLDPHITLQNADFQLPRVAAAWANRLKRDAKDLENEIREVLEENAQAPLAGFAGEPFVNVLEVNLALNKHYAQGN